MNIIPMMNEVLNISNPMIGEPALPDFRFSPDKGAQSMGISALD
jgi:hypothetical protein